LMVSVVTIQCFSPFGAGGMVFDVEGIPATVRN